MSHHPIPRFARINASSARIDADRALITAWRALRSPGFPFIAKYWTCLNAP
jgi:hypothetical protein